MQSLWLFCAGGREECLWQRLHSLQSQKYLLTGPLKKEFADPQPRIWGKKYRECFKLEEEWSVSHSFMSNSLQLHGLYSPPGSSIYGILQTRILEWVAIPFSRGSSLVRDWTQISSTAGWFFTIWATRDAHFKLTKQLEKKWVIIYWDTVLGKNKM